MGLFTITKEPVFLKEDSSALKQIECLKELYNQVNDEGKAEIENEIKLLEAGLYGENQIIFELKNSHIPMVVLHDICLEYEGLSAQMDFLIVTKGYVFVVECKNLVGNITIDNTGSFTRIFDYGKFKKKEGIYSPITQNQRHMELIKQKVIAKQTNIFSKKLAEKAFEENFKSVVVLANPKTVLNAKFAPKEIKNSVIRADQLIEFIKKTNAGYETRSEKAMLEVAESYLQSHVENVKDYAEKYNQYLIQETVEEKVMCPKCGAEMIKRVATKGANAGKAFYGCSNFPKCRGILSIE